MTGHSNTRKWFVIAKKMLFYGILPCLVFVLIIFVWLCWSIRSSVKDISAKAVQEYSGDRIEALISYIQSEKHSLRDRNRVVWALDQIGDERALSVFEKFRSGKDCVHDKYLCRREVNKAINMYKSGFNFCFWLTR